MFNPVRAVQLCVYLIRYLAPLSEWQLNTLLYLCQRDYLLHDLRHLLDDPLEMTPRGPQLKHCAREIAALFALNHGKPNLFNRALEVNDEGLIAVNAKLDEADPLSGTGAWRPVELQAVNATVTERLHFLTLSALRRVISRGILPECAVRSEHTLTVTIQALFKHCGKSTARLQQAEELLQEQLAIDAERAPASVSAGIELTGFPAAAHSFNLTLSINHHQQQRYAQSQLSCGSILQVRHPVNTVIIGADGKVIPPRSAHSRITL